MPHFFNIAITKEPIKLGNGLFFVYINHHGYAHLSRFFIIALYKHDDTKSEYITPKNLLGEYYESDSRFNIEVNPATTEIKLVQSSPANGLSLTICKLVE